MMTFFPLRKIKRNGKYVLFVAVLVFVGFAGYLEYVATNTWDNVGKFKSDLYVSLCFFVYAHDLSTEHLKKASCGNVRKQTVKVIKHKRVKKQSVMNTPKIRFLTRFLTLSDSEESTHQHFSF